MKNGFPREREGDSVSKIIIFSMNAAGRISRIRHPQLRVQIMIFYLKETSRL
jgi:hypothetical protein